MQRPSASWVTLTLNPAWDCTLRVDGPLRPGAVHSVRSETLTAGGKGINVAKALAANGRAVTAGGLLGADDAERFQNEVRSWGIAPRFLTVPGRVRTNLMISSERSEMKVNRPGYPDLAWNAARMHDYLATVAAGGDVVVILSGSLPALFPEDTYAQIIPELRTRGACVVLDSSGAALVKGVAACPDVIKPNRCELEQLTGRTLSSDEQVVETIGRLAERHEAVLVTAGERGAWFAANGIILHGRPPAVRAVDSTGAGDTLLGQFCADYFPRRRLTRALAQRALAAGAAAVEQPGTRPVRAARILELAARATVQRSA